MKERMIPYTCPFCGHVFQIKKDTFLISGFNHEFDKRLENGTFFSHICSHCHQGFYLEYPLIYRKPGHFVLVLSQKEDLDLKAEEMIVRCKNASQFLLSYKILKQGLNLELVLLKKRQLETQMKKSVKFESFDSKNQCLWFEVDHQLKAVRLTLEEVKKVEYNKL